MDLSIVIVSYNTQKFLEKCIDSIIQNTSDKLKYEIIVVDNASKDGILGETYESQYPVLNIKIIRNKDNLGFAKACNIGVKSAKGKYILFLNPDTVIYKHTLEEMVTFMDLHKDAGAATCFVQLTNGKLDDAAHRGFPTPWNALSFFIGLGKIFPNSNFFNGYHLGFKDIDKVHVIDALAGAFMIVRREAGEQIKWWDEDYFFYGEDLEFCYRLKNPSTSSGPSGGWKIYFVPTAKILHYKGVSSGIKEISKNITTADKDSKIKVSKARFDAMRLFYKKHYYKKYPGFINKMIFLGIGLKQWMSERNI